MKSIRLAHHVGFAVLGFMLLACNQDDAGTRFGDTPPLAPFISSFSSAKSSVVKGTATTLTPTFYSGTGSIDHAVGTVVSGQTIAVQPDDDTTYTLTVTGSRATQSRPVRRYFS